jgi:putative CocE/NonD family hydrolase
MNAGSTVLVERDVAVPMLDGTVLRADIWRPATGAGGTSARYPTLLQRTPYDKSDPFVAQHHAGLVPVRAVVAGYVVVIADVRGRGSSDGQFEPFVNERADGVATMEWIARQPWSDGRIGAYGVSYVGATLMLAASGRPPGLAAIAPHETAIDYRSGWLYQSGAFQLGFALLWALALARSELDRRRSRNTEGDKNLARLAAELDALAADPWTAFRVLPLRDHRSLERILPAFGDWLSLPGTDRYWQHLSLDGQNPDAPGIDAPALHIGGWNDVFLPGALDGYARLHDRAASADARANQRLIIGPWAHAVPHETVGQVDYGPFASQGAVDMTALHLRWFDDFLGPRATGTSSLPPARLFVMGIDRWVDFDAWPPPRTRVEVWHLRGAEDGSRPDEAASPVGRLSPAPPDTGEPPDAYAYDPMDPCPTVGGATFLPGLFVGWHAGSQDQRAIEARPDVLSYTSEPLARDLAVIGPVWMELHASTSARGTDFLARLVDVHPDGRAMGVTDGILRLPSREAAVHPGSVTPDEPVRLRIELFPTAMVFRAGHRLRVDITSSSFPRFDRNPNHGGDPATATAADFVVAHQRVFHDARYPSAIHLSVTEGLT